MLLVSQCTGLLLLLALVLVRGEAPPEAGFIGFSALAAVAGTTGIAAFYRGLAVGAMGVVAPISATAAAIPLVVGLAAGERPSALQGVGIALALLGVALASREPGGGEAAPRRSAGVGLALLSALGFGTFFVFMARASEADPIWAVTVSRTVGVAILVAIAAAMRPRLGVGRGELPGLVAVGVFDVCGQTLFAAASTVGLVSVVAVLASLYPVTTVALARFVLGERLRAVQRAGAAGALVGVALISAG